MTETTQPSPPGRVDHNALRTNQGFIILLLAGGFVLGSWRLVALVAVVLLLGAAVPAAALFQGVYRYVLRPAGILRPDLREDEPAPHRFAQAVGGVVTLASAALLVAGWAAVGWTLSAVVAALAALNLFAGICVGCLLFYQLGRLGLPGFATAPVRQP